MKQHQRPPEVTAAVSLGTASCLAGFGFLVAKRAESATAGTLVAWGLGLLLLAWFLTALWRGRRWAWWAQLFFGAYGLAIAPWQLRHVPPVSTPGLYFAQTVLCVAATVLLLLPRARAWFRPNNSSKPTPLRGAA